MPIQFLPDKNVRLIVEMTAEDLQNFQSDIIYLMQSFPFEVAVPGEHPFFWVLKVLEETFLSLEQLHSFPPDS